MSAAPVLPFVLAEGPKAEVEITHEALRHVCRRCGRHFLLCEAEGCRPAPMPVADALADAETLVWVLAQCGYRGPLRTVEDLAMAGLSVLAHPEFSTVFAESDRLFAYAARAAFRLVPGLRGEA